MATPPTAKPIDQPMDPSDVEKFRLIVSKDGLEPVERYPLLQADEDVASFTLEMPPETSAAGLRFVQNKPPTRDGRIITFWLFVEAGMRGDVIFNAGVTLPLELTVVTTGGRTKQRTITERVVNQ